MITPHLMCANFFMIKNVIMTLCYNFSTKTEKPWQNMLHDETILSPAIDDKMFAVVSMYGFVIYIL